MCCAGPLKCPNCGNTENLSCSIDPSGSKVVRKYKVRCSACGTVFTYSLAL